MPPLDQQSLQKSRELRTQILDICSDSGADVNQVAQALVDALQSSSWWGLMQIQLRLISNASQTTCSPASTKIMRTTTQWSRRSGILHSKEID
jgi:hypothetical protein